MAAFDNAGDFVTGDSAALVDPENASKGVRCDGRLSEACRLLTHRWGRTTTKRICAIDCTTTVHRL